MNSYPTAFNNNNGFKIETHRPSASLEMRDGFSVSLRVCTGGNPSEQSHLHHFVQLNIGLPFSLSWKSQDQWIAGMCKPGDIVQLLSTGEREQMRCNEEYQVLELAFDAHFFDQILEKENSRFRHVVNLHDPVLNELLTDIYESTHHDPGEQLYSKSLVIVCAIHIATTYTPNYKKLFSLKGKLSSHQLHEVIKFARTSIHRAVSLEELAASCNLSMYHFSRLFKNTVGVSPYQYVLRMKIEYGRNLIKHKRSIADIAYSLGFTDSAHFCNAFKKFTGHSPLQRMDAKLQHLGRYPFSNNTTGSKKQLAGLSRQLL